MEERDNRCEGYNVCAKKGEDGRTEFGCDDYYCCVYPNSDEYWANYQEPPCVEEDGWVDSYGDSCAWYEKQIEYCQIYGEGNSAPYREPAMESCCYCQAGDAGGTAANEGNFCTWKTEDEISEGWMVDLGADGPVYKDCWFFEQKGGRCRGAWGEKPGNDGLTAQEVCCVCRFGNIAQHWGRTINNDGTDYNDASKETKVGEMPGMDEELDGLMDKNGGRSMSGTFARTATPELTPTDFAVYGFAVVGLIAAGRAAYVSCGALAKTSTHTAIPDQEI